MKTRTRHWKQRWDANAPMIFLKRMRMGDDPQRPFVLPGDPVTDAIREHIGPHRLRRWWDARVIGRADFDPTVRGGYAAPAAGIEHTGRGWYVVTFDDGSTKRVRGEDNAKLELSLRVNAGALRAALES
jgi:hypothetical protein